MLLKFQDGPPTWTNIWTLFILLSKVQSFVNHCGLFWWDLYGLRCIAHPLILRACLICMLPRTVYNFQSCPLPKTITIKSKTITTHTKPASTRRKQKRKKPLQRLANPRLTWMGSDSQAQPLSLLQSSSLQHKPTSGKIRRLPALSQQAAYWEWQLWVSAPIVFLLGPPICFYKQILTALKSSLFKISITGSLLFSFPVLFNSLVIILSYIHGAASLWVRVIYRRLAPLKTVSSYSVTTTLRGAAEGVQDAGRTVPERWHSSYKHNFLPQVQFPTSTWWPTPSVTPVLGGFCLIPIKVTTHIKSFFKCLEKR